jgi:hypothetical protein
MMAAVLMARQEARAAPWARRAGALAVALLITAGLSHRYGLLDTPGLFAVMAVVPAFSILALVLAALAFRRIWNNDDLGTSDLAAAAMLAILALAPYLAGGLLYATRPMLVDISSDTDNPPPMPMAAAERRPGMNPLPPISPANAASQAAAYPLVTGRRYDLTLDQTLETVRTLIRERGWEVRAENLGVPSNEVTIEARARTPVLALPVDIGIRLIEDDGSIFVDMRSAWPYGPNDLGDNAGRIANFLEELDSAVLRRSSAASAG